MNTDRKNIILEKVAKKKRKKPSWQSTNPISRMQTSPGFGAAIGAPYGAFIGSLSGAGAEGFLGTKKYQWKAGLKGALIGAGVGAGLMAVGPALQRWFHARGTVGRLRKAKRDGKSPTRYLTDSEKQILRELKKK